MKEYKVYCCEICGTNYNALKDLQEYMKDKYAITGLSKYRDYYAAIGEAIGEMLALDRIVKKNNELKKELEIAIGCIKDCGDCPVGQCDAGPAPVWRPRLSAAGGGARFTCLSAPV